MHPCLCMPDMQSWKEVEKYIEDYFSDQYYESMIKASWLSGTIQVAKELNVPMPQQPPTTTIQPRLVYNLDRTRVFRVKQTALDTRTGLPCKVVFFDIARETNPKLQTDLPMVQAWMDVPMVQVSSIRPIHIDPDGR